MCLKYIYDGTEHNNQLLHLTNSIVSCLLIAAIVLFFFLSFRGEIPIFSSSAAWQYNSVWGRMFSFFSGT